MPKDNPLELARRVGRILKSKGLSLACAESCSGGLLSHFITNIPGSSRYFKGAIICYSLESKSKLLGINARILSQKGAVSREVALLLAQNVRKVFSSDIGLSITGVAGPSRDQNQNPVGTVFIGISVKNKTQSFNFRFKGSRLSIKKKASIEALRILIRLIQ